MKQPMHQKLQRGGSNVCVSARRSGQWPQDLDLGDDFAKRIGKISDDEFIAIDPGNQCPYT